MNVSGHDFVGFSVALKDPWIVRKLVSRTYCFTSSACDLGKCPLQQNEPEISLPDPERAPYEITMRAVESVVMSLSSRTTSKSLACRR
jgi:hypothetical protein